MYGTMLLSTSMRMIWCMGTSLYPKPPKKLNSEFLHFHFGTLGGPINGWTARLPPRIFILMKFMRNFPSLPNKTWHVWPMKPSTAEKKKRKKSRFGASEPKTTSSTCSWLICWSFAEPDHRRHEMHKRSRGTKPQAHGRWGYKNHQGISWKFKGTPAIATETRPY